MKPREVFIWLLCASAARGAKLHDSRPDAARPDAARPDAARPGAARPVAARPVAARPVAARPVAARPVAARPVAARSNCSKPLYFRGRTARTKAVPLRLSQGCARLRQLHTFPGSVPEHALELRKGPVG